METKDKLIEKLKEIFNYLNDRANTVTLNWSYYIDLRKEIAALDKQVEEEKLILHDWQHLPEGKYKDNSEWHIPNKDDMKQVEEQKSKPIKTK